MFACAGERRPSPCKNCIKTQFYKGHVRLLPLHAKTPSKTHLKNDFYRVVGVERERERKP